MPGYLVSGSIFLDPGAQSQWEKYLCPKCDLLLREAVQPSCGHWLCQSCAEELFRSDSGGSGPRCPRKECGEELVGEDGLNFFPDRFVRREIQTYDVQCLNHLEGCSWQGKFADYEEHVNKECRFAKHPCKHCGVLLSGSELASHVATCPKAGHQCPLVGLGCLDKSLKVSSEMAEHLGSPESVVTHLTYIATAVKELQGEVGLSSLVPGRRQSGVGAESRRGDTVETDSALAVKPKGAVSGVSVDKDGGGGTNDQTSTKQLVVSARADEGRLGAYGSDPRAVLEWEQSVSKLREEVKGMMKGELQKREKEIVALQTTVTKLEKQLRAKNAELEDRDFRLSLIENSSFDGTMVWKIPQFEQRMADAKSGKYTSIFSLPFYTGRYGYKMCLRLYILGDGTGKNTHMSLFFVIMKNEFDNILPWPFTHRVTFKLINQNGGRDISETFQPDPTSSSFKKPKSDMNIASGCPKFVSHQELKNGFIVDDTIFIKCMVDLSARMDLQPFRK